MSTIRIPARVRDLIEGLAALGVPTHFIMNVSLPRSGEVRKFKVRLPGQTITGALSVCSDYFGERGKIVGPLVVKGKEGGYALSEADVKYALAQRSWANNELPNMSYTEFMAFDAPP